MTRIALAVATAFALAAAAPALAGPGCKDCPMHKGDAAAKAEGKDAAKHCACGTDPKTCACAGKCDCHASHDHQDHHDHSKQETKKPEKS